MLKSGDKKKIKTRLLISNIMLCASILLLVGGIIFLSSDIIRRHLRDKKIDSATSDMEQIIADNIAAGESAEEIEMTMVIDPNALEVYGEGYDYYDDQYMSQAINEASSQVNEELDDTYTGYITLHGVGMLDIPSIDLHVPIWENTNSNSLRYGVGHYVDSVPPGRPGNCTIMGHHMRKYGSIFNRLEEVEIGNVINITDLRGHQYTYIVDDLRIVSAEEMMQNIRGGLTDTRQVTLVTCVYTNSGKMRLMVIGHIQDGT